jgi:hypothetical protein
MATVVTIFTFPFPDDAPASPHPESETTNRRHSFRARSIMS